MNQKAMTCSFFLPMFLYILVLWVPLVVSQGEGGRSMRQVELLLNLRMQLLGTKTENLPDAIAVTSKPSGLAPVFQRFHVGRKIVRKPVTITQTTPNVRIGKITSSTDCNVIVSKTGQGFGRIQDAIDSLGKPNSLTRVCIYPGTYTEQVRVKPGQNHIQLVGASATNTIVVADNRQSRSGNPFYSATLVVEGDYFSATNLFIQNSAMSTSDPSPAVALLGTKSQFQRVNIESWTDTLAVFTGQHLFADGYISGLTDMIWGFGRIAIVNSNINVRHFPSGVLYIGSVTAMGTDWATGNLGYGGAILDGCSINGDGRAYLGRPYRPQSLVVYNNVYMGGCIVNQGWSDWHSRMSSGQVRFQEFNSQGPGAGNHEYAQVTGAAAPADLQWASFIGYPF